MDNFNEIGDRLMAKLAKSADGRTKVVMHTRFSHATLDAIGKAAFGMDINCVENENSPFPSAIQCAFGGFAEGIVDPFVKWNPWKRALRASVRKALALTRETGRGVIKERMRAIKAGEYVPEDVLTHITNMSGHLDMETLVDHFMTIFVAGQETTANAMAFFLLSVGRRPEILKRLRDEVAEVIGERPYVRYEDTGKLEYMSQVFKETMRLYPTGTITFRSPAKDIKVGGYLVSKDTAVMMCMYASNRSSNHFENPLEFDPERFAKDRPQPNVYTYFPFSLGPRNCIGQTFAKLQYKVILAKFFQNFEFQLDPDQDFGIEENTTLKPKSGTIATITLCNKTL